MPTATLFTHNTKIQANVLPHLMEWRDLMGTAKIGSGKTTCLSTTSWAILQSQVEW